MEKCDQTIKMIRSNRIVKSVFLYLPVVLVFVLLYKTVGFYYAINDDTSMLRIASGEYNGVPDGHLLFIRYALGVLIAKLFTIAPSIDWYGTVMISILLICVCLILKRIFDVTSKCKKATWVRIFAIAFLVFLIILDVIFFQFTTVAGFVAATTLFLLATDNEKSIKLSKIILYVVLLTLAYTIRKKVFLMIMPFILFVMFMNLVIDVTEENGSIKACNVKKIISSHSKSIVFYGLVTVFALISVTVVEITDKNAYSSEEWSECRSYVHYRSRIVDYSEFPAYDEYKDLWDEIEVSREMHGIIEKSFGVLPNIGADELYKISTITDEEPVALRDVVELFWDKTINDGCFQYKICFLIVLILSIVVVLSKSIPIGEKFKIIGILGISFAEFVYLLINGRIPNRVMYVWTLATVAGLGGAILRLCNSIEELATMKWISKLGRKSKCVLCLGLFVGVALVSLNAARVTVIKLIDYQDGIKLYETYKDYLRENNDTIFLVNTGTVESKKQFTFYRTECDKLNTIGTRGWTARLPMLIEWEKAIGIDVTQMPLCQEGVLYITKDENYLDTMNAYMKSIGWENGYRIVDVVSLSNEKVIYVASWN